MIFVYLFRGPLERLAAADRGAVPALGLLVLPPLALIDTTTTTTTTTTTNNDNNTYNTTSDDEIR